MKIKPTHYQVQIKIFEMAGCVYVRTKGDHIIYHYPGAVRPVIIPKIQRSPDLRYQEQYGYNRVEQRKIL
jgi:predicted RNA binding protein YcfA (HicA-like mRNA interferase family)